MHKLSPEEKLKAEILRRQRMHALSKINMKKRPCLCGKLIASNTWPRHQAICASARSMPN